MSDRDPNACGLCGGVRDERANDSNEYHGGSSRGCPACGNSISPVVTVKDGVIHHDGRPVGASRFKDPSQGSFVRPHEEGGYKAGHYANGGHDTQHLITGHGKTPREAAENAARADAEHLGRQFVKRPPAVEKAIKTRLKADGYENY